MKIYITRHGQVDSNYKKIYNVSNDEDINETGIKQAEELRDKIKDMDLDFDIVYCSPYLRAKHTAQIINYDNIKTVFDERLRERSAGDLKGKPLEFTDREEYWNYYSTINYAGEETMQSLFERVANFLDELKNKEYNKVMVVAHRGVTRAFYAYFEGIPKDGKMLNLGLNNCEIKEYEL